MTSIVHFVKESAGRTQQVTETNPLPVSSSPQQATRIDDTGTYQYFGFATVGASDGAAVWMIKRLTIANPQSLTFADGNSDYDNIWSNRASLSYS